jgi:hypothetical protein
VLSLGEVLAVVFTAVVAFALAFVLIRLLDHLRRKDAESEARDIVEKAKQ